MNFFITSTPADPTSRVRDILNVENEDKMSSETSLKDQSIKRNEILKAKIEEKQREDGHLKIGHKNDSMFASRGSGKEVYI
jgi:hypothetical protein